MFIDYSYYIGNIILGFCMGLGSALATYLVNRAIVKRIENLEKKR
jgi:hypothetical protein